MSRVTQAVGASSPEAKVQIYATAAVIIIIIIIIIIVVIVVIVIIIIVIFFIIIVVIIMIVIIIITVVIIIHVISLLHLWCEQDIWGNNKVTKVESNLVVIDKAFNPNHAKCILPFFRSGEISQSSEIISVDIAFVQAPLHTMKCNEQLLFCQVDLNCQEIFKSLHKIYILYNIFTNKYIFAILHMYIWVEVNKSLFMYTYLHKHQCNSAIMI